MTDKKLKMIGYSGRKKKAPVSGKKIKQAYAAILLGFLLIPGGLLMTGLIQSVIDEEVANFIKTPKPSDAGYSDFLTDDRPDAIPMYTNYYMHNLTNAEDVLNGSIPIFEEIGPYAYRVYSYKYDVSYNEDYSEVTYKSYSNYVFQPNLSAPGLDPSDIIMNVNPGYLGVLNLMGDSEATLVEKMVPTVLGEVKDTFLATIEEVLGPLGLAALPEPKTIFYWDWAEDHFPAWGDPFGVLRWLAKGLIDDMGVDIDGQMLGIDLTNDPDGHPENTSGDPDGFLGQPDDLSLVYRPEPEFPFLGNDPITNIPLSVCEQLWNSSNPNSLTGFDSMNNPIWIDAISDGYIREDLADIFGLSTGQIRNITTWLGQAIAADAWLTNLCQFQIEEWESDIITVRPVIEWLFEGVDELIYNVDPSMAKVGIFTSCESEWESEIAGASPSTFNTGQTNINEIGQFIEYNEESIISIWKEDVYVSGTGGTQFVPGVTQDSELEIFIPQFLRPLTVEYSKDVTIKGVDLLEFVLPDDAFPIDEVTFYDDIFGLANMQPSYGLPVYLGQPHFYGADPSLLDDVNISAPSQDLHELYIDVEPNTGATMAARLRMGIYVKVTQTDYWYEDIKEAIYPVFWLEQSAEIPDDLATMFKSLVYLALDIKTYLHAGFVGGGAALLCVGMVVTITQRRKVRNKRLEKFETQKKEFHKYKHELKKYKESKMVTPPSVPKKKNLDQTK